MRITFVNKNIEFKALFLILILFFFGFTIHSVDAQNFIQNGRVVIIGFGIGHIDTLDKTNVFSTQMLLTNSIKWASESDTPNILLLVDPSVNLLGERSLDPDFIEDTLSDFSITRLVDSFEGVTFSELENYDLVIWSGESSPLRSPSISNTSRALLEFFEAGHGVILISDDATWDSTYDANADPKTSSDITRSLTQVVTISTGESRTSQTIVSTFEGSMHPIMNSVLLINVLSEKYSIEFGNSYYSNDIDDSLPGVNAQVLAINSYGNPAVIVQEFTGNRYPISASDDSFVVSEDSVNNDLFVLYNDVSQTGKLTISSFDTVTLDGYLERNDDHFSFTPKSNFSGKTSFSYFVQDELGNKDVSLVNILVTPVNDSPIAKPSSFTISEDSSLNSRLLASDADGDKLKFSIIRNIEPNAGSLSMSDDGRIVYSPAENYVGTVDFTFTVSDGTEESLPATITIKVTSVNDEPAIWSGVFSTDEDKNLTGILFVKDPDGDTLTYSLLHDTPSTTGQTFIMIHGPFAYIPAKGFFGETYFVFEVDDGQSKTQHTVMITVFPKSDPPKAIDQTISLDEDSIVDIILEGTDSHGYELSYSVIAPSKFGTISGDDYSLQYTPNENYHGDDEIVFEVSNGRFSDTGTILIKITPVNDPPIAIDDKISTKENLEVVIPVLFNDIDVDGDELTLISVENPLNGIASINAEKLISYTPNPGVVNDLEIFDYTISDSHGAKSTGTVVVEILQKSNTPGEVYLSDASFDSDTLFSFDVTSDGKSMTGNISYEDSFSSIHLNSDDISFFSIDQSNNSVTLGGVSFNDKYFSIFVADNGESGRDDVVKIKIRDSSGSLIYQKEGAISKGNAIVSSNFLEIPVWVKNTAGWWANDQITDSDFVDGLQFLIQNDIIKLTSIPEFSDDGETKIPSWIKNRALWWSEDKLSDSDFVNGIAFLIEKGIMKI